MPKDIDAVDIERLAELSKKGNREAFGRLYDCLFVKIYRFAYYRSYRKDAAEDITSLTFLKALENLQSFSREKGNFSAWLYGIARNCLADYYRQKSKTADLMSVWDLAACDDVEIDAENRSNWENLQPYLSRLSAVERDILFMRVWDELPYQEIAVIIGKSEASCRMVFSRTIACIRKEMLAAMFIMFVLLKDSLFH